MQFIAELTPTVRDVRTSSGCVSDDSGLATHGRRTVAPARNDGDTVLATSNIDY